MLTDRIIGAFTFRGSAYAEVERDTSFTQTAWILVAVSAFLSQLGTQAGNLSTGNFIGWILGTLIFTVVSVAGFALACFIISWLGKTMFQADISFDEAVRTLGLAYVWNAVGVLGVLGGILPVLACLLAPISIIAALAGFAAWLFAIKEALDLDWMPTIVVVVAAFLVNLMLTFLVGLILAPFGLAAAGLFGAMGGS